MEGASQRPGEPAVPAVGRADVSDLARGAGPADICAGYAHLSDGRLSGAQASRKLDGRIGRLSATSLPQSTRNIYHIGGMKLLYGLMGCGFSRDDAPAVPEE